MKGKISKLERLADGLSAHVAHEATNELMRRALRSYRGTVSPVEAGAKAKRRIAARKARRSATGSTRVRGRAAPSRAGAGQ
jgi:hypothetical protein